MKRYGVYTWKKSRTRDSSWFSAVKTHRKASGCGASHRACKEECPSGRRGIRCIRDDSKGPAGGTAVPPALWQQNHRNPDGQGGFCSFFHKPEKQYRRIDKRSTNKYYIDNTRMYLARNTIADSMNAESEWTDVCLRVFDLFFKVNGVTVPGREIPVTLKSH